MSLPENRLLREGNPSPGEKAGFVPQHRVEGQDTYEHTLGKDGSLNVRVTEALTTDAELVLVKAELQAIKAQLAAQLNVSVENLPVTQQVAGTVDVGNLPESYDVVDSVARTELAAIKAQLADVVNVQLTGSIVPIYGATLDDRPAANSVPLGATFMVVGNADTIWQSNGTEWVVLT